MSHQQPNNPERKISPAELRLRQKMREKRRKQRQKQRMLLMGGIIGIILVIIFVVQMFDKKEPPKDKPPSQSQSELQLQSEMQSASEPQSQMESQPESEPESQSENTDSSVPQAADVSSTTNTDDWRMILANKNTPLPEGYKPELKTLTDSHLQMQTEAAEAFDQMRAAANATGLHLMACSTYRPIERQTELFNAEIEKWKSKGYSQEEATKKAATVVMVPGCSEHNTGLAVDVGSITNQRIEVDFENEPEFKWLQEYAAEYGFILRYPKDKQAITGVTYEPWHYRYVGAENAKKIQESGLTLEEYLSKQ